MLSKARSQELGKIVSPLPSSQHVKFSEESSPVSGTLIGLTKVDSKLNASFLEQLNISKISPKSGMTESTPERQEKINPTKLSFKAVHKTKESDARKKNLYRTLGTNPTD